MRKQISCNFSVIFFFPFLTPFNSMDTVSQAMEPYWIFIIYFLLYNICTRKITSAVVCLSCRPLEDVIVPFTFRPVLMDHLRFILSFPFFFFYISCHLWILRTKSYIYPTGVNKHDKKGNVTLLNTQKDLSRFLALQC